MYLMKHLTILFCLFGIRLEIAYGFYSAFASPSASTSVTAYSMGSTTVSIYYMLTQTQRGPLGKILAAIFLPIQKDRDGEYSYIIPTDKWDGDTKLIASCLLYYYSLAVNPILNNKYSVYSSKVLPKFPWGSIETDVDPFKGMTIIHNYILSLNGGMIKIPLNNVDIWQLYPLAVLKEYSRLRKKKFSLKKKFSRNKKSNKHNVDIDLNEPKFDLNYNQDSNTSNHDQVNTRIIHHKIDTSNNKTISLNNINNGNRNISNGQRSTLDTYLQNKKLESSSIITDFNVKKKRCAGKLTMVCKSKTNSKVNYISVPWMPGERTAFEELKVIYDYTNTLESNSLNNICVENKINSKLSNFSLALILYLRERQFDNNYVDNINYKRSSLRKFYNKILGFSSFMFDLFGLAHRKNSLILAPWKNILEEQWKLNPSKTIEYLITSAHLQELRADRYSSSEWSEFDLVIASIVHFFVIILGVPLLYGQYISKVSRRHFLIDREALSLQKYNVPAPHSVKYEIDH